MAPWPGFLQVLALPKLINLSYAILGPPLAPAKAQASGQEGCNYWKMNGQGESSELEVRKTGFEVKLCYFSQCETFYKLFYLWASVAVNEENIYIHSGQEQERALENENQEKFHK